MPVSFVEVSDEELIRAGKHVEGFIQKIRSVIPIMAEAFAVHALVDFVGETIEAGAHVFDLANKLGVGSEELQQFQFAAKLMGVESETAAHSLGFLSRTVGEALLGSKEAATTFQRLGVGIRDGSGHAKDLNEILPEVSDALLKLPDQQTRAAYAMKLFGREGMALLPVLGQGSDKLREVAKEFQELGGGMSKEFVESAKETQDETDKLKFALTNIKIVIIGALLPAVKALVLWAKRTVVPMIEWLKHSSALKTGLIALSTAIGGKLIGSVIKLMRVLGILKGTVLGTLKAFAGFALPLVGIGLLYLAFDDFFGLLDGGDSEIGALLEELGGVEGKEKFVNDLKDSWHAFLDLLGLEGPNLDSTTDKVSNLSKVVKFLAGAFYEVVTTAKLLFDSLVGTLNVVKQLALALGNLATLKVDFSGVGKAIDKTGNRVVEDAKDIWNPGNHPATADAAAQAQAAKAQEIWKPGNFQQTADAAAQLGVGKISYGAPSVPAPTANNTKTVTVKQMTVNVTAGKNPEETGKRVGQAGASELEKAMRDTSAAVNTQ